MSLPRRVLAMTSAVGLAVGLGLTALATPAQAAPRMTVEGNNDLEGGETVTITLSGFTANNPVAIGMCPTGRELKGAGDCGPAKDNHSTLTATDASGGVTVKLTVPDKGEPLGNTSGAPVECPPCSVAAANIQKNSETASVKLKYASGGGGAAADDTAADDTAADDTAADDTAADDTAADTTADDTAADAAADDSGATTAETGPADTLATGLVASLLVLLGMVVLVASRYRGAHRRRA